MKRKWGDEEPTQVDRVVDDRFSAEEMLAMREQYEERARAAEERADALEWELRMVLARIRDAEVGARRAADEMGRVHASLARLVEPAAAQAPARAAAPPPHAVAQPPPKLAPQAKNAAPQKKLPPIPPRRFVA